MMNAIIKRIFSNKMNVIIEVKYLAYEIINEMPFLVKNFK